MPACDALGDELFVRLLSKSPKLKCLKVGGCDMLSSDRALTYIARYMSLEKLELSQTQLDAACFALLWCSLPHLVALDVDRCDELIQMILVGLAVDAPAAQWREGGRGHLTTTFAR